MPQTKDSKYTLFVLRDHDRLLTYICIDSTELILDSFCDINVDIRGRVSIMLE
jgi:hypothetical protein